MEIIKTKNGNLRFKEKVRLSTGKMLTKTFRRKTDAITWKRKVETEKAQGILGVPKASKMLFGDVAESWYERRIKFNRAHKTIKSYRYILDRHLIPTFGNRFISEITLSSIEDLKCYYLRDGKKPKTINNILTMIRSVFYYALDEGAINDLPFKKSIFLKSKKPDFNYYDDSEVRALLISNRFEPIFPMLFLGVHTGMRIGEVLGLCWDAINFNTGQIEIKRTLHAQEYLQEYPKSGKSRYFPMNESLKEFFRELQRNQRDPKFVFVNELGRPFNPDHFSGRNLKVACSRANVKRLGFHCLRHTFASHFMMSGGNIFDLQKLLGHSDIKTTMVYAHLSPKHLEEASRIVNFGVHYKEREASGPLLALASSEE